MPHADTYKEYVDMLMFNIRTIESYLKKVMKTKRDRTIVIELDDIVEKLEREVIIRLPYTEVYEDVL